MSMVAYAALFYWMEMSRIFAFWNGAPGRGSPTIT